MSKSFPIMVFLSFLLFSCTMFFNGADAQSGRSTQHTLNIDHTMRSYTVYKPVGTGARPPLMIVMHGGLGNAETIEQTTRMNDVANVGRFIVVYPNGIGGRFGRLKNMRTWNAGQCCGRAVKTNVNDVAFIERMITNIDSKFSIDRKRVYLTGISNGAMMAYRLACEIPEKIAAIVPVSGTLALDDIAPRSGMKYVPVLHIHGDQDQNVPLDGGKGAKGVSGVAHRSVWQTMEMMAAPRKYTGLQIKTTEAGGQILHYRYQCKDGAPVELLVIKGGEHEWPGGISGMDASQRAWLFAKQFSK